MSDQSKLTLFSGCVQIFGAVIRALKDVGVMPMRLPMRSIKKGELEDEALAELLENSITMEGVCHKNAHTNTIMGVAMTGYLNGCVKVISDPWAPALEMLTALSTDGESPCSKDDFKELVNGIAVDLALDYLAACRPVRRENGERMPAHQMRMYHAINSAPTLGLQQILQVAKNWETLAGDTSRSSEERFKAATQAICLYSLLFTLSSANHKARRTDNYELLQALNALAADLLGYANTRYTPEWFRKEDVELQKLGNFTDIVWSWAGTERKLRKLIHQASDLLRKTDNGCKRNGKAA